MDETVSTSEAVTLSTPETVPEKVSVVEASKEETKEEEVEYKVFVGNLAFSTNEHQLADFFNKTGKV